MGARTSLLLAAIVFLLAACSGSDTDTAGTGAQPAAALTRAAQLRQQKQKQKQRQQQQTSVFTPLTSTIDRAKSVQATVDKQAAQQRKLIEKESR